MLPSFHLEDGSNKFLRNAGILPHHYTASQPRRPRLESPNAIEQSHSWETDSHSTSQEIPRLYGTRMFITVFTRARYWSPSWVGLIQSTVSPPYFPKIHSNIFFPSTPRSSRWSLPFSIAVKTSNFTCSKLFDWMFMYTGCQAQILTPWVVVK